MLQELAPHPNGNHTLVTNDGASGPYDAGGCHAFGSHDAMEIVAQWGQIEEPSDQLMCVDRVAPQEFGRGSDSQTG
jgi:hypothetical protein